jgi:hypothetical protein
VVRHILPNALGPVIIAGTIDVAAAIIAESTLSFLGLGFPPDVPTWGRLLYDAKDFLDIAAHWALFPGGAIFEAVVAINFIGDGMRDRSNHKAGDLMSPARGSGLGCPAPHYRRRHAGAVDGVIVVTKEGESLCVAADPMARLNAHTAMSILALRNAHGASSGQIC